MQRNWPPEEYFKVYPADAWTEEDGDVIWWHFPACEPPTIGAHECMGATDRDGEPTDCARLQREGWLTHWSRIPIVWDEDGQPARFGGGSKQ